MNTSHINKNQREGLYQWLSAQNINPMKINREFSDAIAMAHLLKKMFPRLVDLHNYPSANSAQLKLINWRTLNQKVLQKVGLGQSHIALECFSKASPGAIEALLYSIQQLEETVPSAMKTIRLSAEQMRRQGTQRNDDTKMKHIQVRDEIVQIPQKTIPYSVYEETLRESQAKDKLLIAVQKKLSYLDSILQMKTRKLNELSALLDNDVKKS